MSWGSLGVLLLTPLWAVVLHALGSRASRRLREKRQVAALLCCLLSAGASTLAVLSLEGKSPPSLLFFTALVALLLAHVYFHLFNMSETARRIRLLVEIRDGRMPREESSSAQQLIRRRVARLEALGQIDCREGRYHARRSWLWAAAWLFFATEQLLFPGRGGPKRSELR